MPKVKWSGFTTRRTLCNISKYDRLTWNVCVSPSSTLEERTVIKGMIALTKQNIGTALILRLAIIWKL